MAAYGPGNKWRVAIQTRSLPVVELNIGFCQQPLFRFRDRATTALMTGIGWKADGLCLEIDRAQVS